MSALTVLSLEEKQKLFSTSPGDDRDDSPSLLSCWVAFYDINTLQYVDTPAQLNIHHKWFSTES